MIIWLVGGIIAYLLHTFTFRRVIGTNYNDHLSYTYKYCKHFDGWKPDVEECESIIRVSKAICFITCFIPWANFILAILFWFINFTAKTVNGDTKIKLF